MIPNCEAKSDGCAKKHRDCLSGRRALLLAFSCDQVNASLFSLFAS
jgi:hypothetical protein